MKNLKLNLHWTVYCKPIAFLALIATSAFLNLNSTMALYISLFAAIPMFRMILIDLTKRYEINGKNVIVEHGILARVKKDIPISKINDVTITQTLFQRIFGAGNIRILTGNDVACVLSGIDHPEEFKRIIHKE